MKKYNSLFVEFSEISKYLGSLNPGKIRVIKRNPSKRKNHIESKTYTIIDYTYNSLATYTNNDVPIKKWLKTYAKSTNPGFLFHKYTSQKRSIDAAAFGY
jgi:hypothetical protein